MTPEDSSDTGFAAQPGIDRRRSPRAFSLAPFRPRLLDVSKSYDRRQFVTDLMAGLTVGVLALPLAIAFAIASGMSPQSGIYTAIIAGFLISALGGSRVQIGGPTGAFIVIVYAIVVEYGVANLLLCTIMAGAMLFAMGLARIGTWIRFVPVSVITGFTKGIAVLILLSQVKDFLGLDAPELPPDFFGKLAALWQALPSVNVSSVLLGTGSLLVIALWPKAWRLVPSPIVALVAGTIAAGALGLEVETIGSRFGEMPSGLPPVVWPELSAATLGDLVFPAFTIALLGAIESLLSARVADALIDDRHDPNQELMAQGLANIAVPFFGGFCATGAIARTSTNVQMGARTPVAGIVHALTLLAIVLVAAPAAKHVPLTTLAAILIVVAWNMGEWRDLRALSRYTFNYRTVLLTTFVLTVVLDLTVAVEVGMVLAAIFFITRVSQLTGVRELPNPHAPLTRVYVLYGSLFFGAAAKLEPLLALASPADPTRVLVLDMRKVLNVDTTGLEILETLQAKLARNGKRLLIAGAGEQPLSLFRRTQFAERLGSDAFMPDVPKAIAYAVGTGDRSAEQE
ncbi:MAG TPA: SulP family inorganic anion transporter [Burkholderiales bacterium]|nr:SulP family inorganic anion transporter [Burkholderiales bacterium]